MKKHLDSYFDKLVSYQDSESCCLHGPDSADTAQHVFWDVGGLPELCSVGMSNDNAAEQKEEIDHKNDWKQVGDRKELGDHA